jgi:hypothetical protein
MPQHFHLHNLDILFTNGQVQRNRHPVLADCVDPMEWAKQARLQEWEPHQPPAHSVHQGRNPVVDFGRSQEPRSFDVARARVGLGFLFR